MRVPARNVCVCYGLWNPPTASLPNCISAPRVASWRKIQRISFNSSSCALVPVVVINLATCLCASKLKRRGWWKKPSPIFWIWTAIPSVNPTYSIFNVQKTHYFSNTVHYCRSSMPRLSAVCSDWPIDPVHCDWPNTTSTRWKCNAPFHNRQLQLSISYQFKPERWTESRDRHSDDARMYLHTNCG